MTHKFAHTKGKYRREGNKCKLLYSCACPKTPLSHCILLLLPLFANFFVPRTLFSSKSEEEAADCVRGESGSCCGGEGGVGEEGPDTGDTCGGVSRTHASFETEEGSFTSISA